MLTDPTNTVNSSLPEARHQQEVLGGTGPCTSQKNQAHNLGLMRSGGFLLPSNNIKPY